mmetsp:Transcript_56281/g.98290  ORF Transcript_56281/g.98290 Transcript_56281/m.98290 type:complete len:88 (+) Transcript_56281:575-838(+)
MRATFAGPLSAPLLMVALVPVELAPAVLTALLEIFRFMAEPAAPAVTPTAPAVTVEPDGPVAVEAAVAAEVTEVVALALTDGGAGAG